MNLYFKAENDEFVVQSCCGPNKQEGSATKIEALCFMQIMP
jgi:hypothetical protein